jgi:hypothetical protein
MGTVDPVGAPPEHLHLLNPYPGAMALEFALFPYIFPTHCGFWTPARKTSARLGTWDDYCRNRVRMWLTQHTMYPAWLLTCYQLATKIKLSKVSASVRLTDAAAKKFELSKDDVQRLNRSMPADIPGSASFFTRKLRECQAACARFERMPDFFMITVSETLQPEMQALSAQVKGIHLTPEELARLSRRPPDPAANAAEPPTTANPPHPPPPANAFEHHFYNRAPNEVNRLFWSKMAYIRTTMLDKPHPIFGEVKYYVIKYEFQSRGTAHAHISLWLENPADVERVNGEITGA